MNSDSWSHYLHRPISPDEDRLYLHFRQCVENESPHQVIERFNQLFIEASGYPDPLVWSSLQRIIGPAHNPISSSEFRFILNRCCYTLINPWQLQHQRFAVPLLVDLFDALPTNFSQSPTRSRLRNLVRDFVDTEQYQALHHLSQLLSSTGNDRDREWNQPLETSLKRYPYLYGYFLLTKDSDTEHKTNVSQLWTKAQRQFEQELTRYDNYRMERPCAESALNPTLLGDAELNQALDYYLGGFDRQDSYQNAVKRFKVHSQMIRSYREFKEDLTDYLIAPVFETAPQYARQFKQKIWRDCLKDLIADADSHRVSDFLLKETCRRLLNCLIIDSQLSYHHTFIDLISNIGSILTMEILMRIVLFCRAIKPWLDQRFARLFEHYAKNEKHSVEWLVNILEHANVAFTTNWNRFST